MATEGVSRLRFSADTKDFTAAINAAQNQLTGFSKSAIDQYNQLDKAQRRNMDSLLKQANALGKTRQQQLIYNASLKGVPTSMLEEVQKKILDTRDATNKAAEAAQRLGEFLGKGLALAGTLMMAGAIGSVYKFISATREAEKEQAQLSAVLRSTGSSAGWSQEQLNKMAVAMSSLSGKSLFSPGEITEAQTKLLSFTNIVGTQVPKALQAAMDMATREGMSLTQAMESVGRALDIPSKGLTALSRQGFKFTDDVKKQLEVLESQGKVMEAQKVILDAMSESYKGAAEAGAGPFENALKRLQDTITDVMTGKEGSLDGMTSAVNDLIKTISAPEFKEAFQGMIGGLLDIAKAAANALVEVRNFWNFIKEDLLPATFGSDKPLDIARGMVASLESDIGSLQNALSNLSAEDAGGEAARAAIEAQLARKQEELKAATERLNLVYKETLEANWSEGRVSGVKTAVFGAKGVLKPDRPSKKPVITHSDNKAEREAQKNRENYLKELTRMNAQYDAIQAQAANKRNQALQQFDDELSMFGLGSKAQERIKEQRSVLDSVQGMFDDLEKATARASEAAKLAGAEFDETPYIKARELLNNQLDLRLQDLKDYYAKVDVIESSYGEGLKQGIADFADEANNVFRSMSNVTKKALDGMADSLTEFTISGKADFKGLANSIIEDLIRIQYQKVLTGIFGGGSDSGIFGSILGGLFGGKVSKNALGGVYNSPSLSSYSNQIVDSPKLFAFARGGMPNLGLMGEAGSEAIMPLRRGSDGSLGVQAIGGGGGGGGDVNVTVIVNEGGSQTSTSGDTRNSIAQELASGVEVVVKQVLVKERKQGGMLWNAAHGRT